MAIDINALPEQDGRVALITGSNTGLGFHNALDLAAKGAKVVMACRSEDRARGAMDRIYAEVPDADLEFLAADVSSLGSVRSAVAEFRAHHDSLDLLINNAGIGIGPYAQTVDGLERQMATNYWGHFLLTMSLIDLMPDDTDSRVVTVSSIAHKQGKAGIRFEDIHWEQDYSGTGAYRQSKLACLMFTLELDRRLTAAGKSILSVASHPGISETELGRKLPKALKLLTHYVVVPLLGHDPDKASLPTLLAAIGPDVEGGDYFGPQSKRETRGEPGKATIDERAQDEEAATRLWELSMEVTGAADLPF